MSARAKIVKLDATGYRCPMPVILMERALRGLSPGTDLQIVADDPVAAVDLPHSARAAGWRAERLPGPEGTCVFLVTAPGNPAAGEALEPEAGRAQGRHFVLDDGKG